MKSGEVLKKGKCRKQYKNKQRQKKKHNIVLLLISIHFSFLVLVHTTNTLHLNKRDLLSLKIAKIKIDVFVIVSYKEVSLTRLQSVYRMDLKNVFYLMQTESTCFKGLIEHVIYLIRQVANQYS